MRFKPVLPILITVLLTSCSNSVKTFESKIFPFDTFVDIKIMEGSRQNVKDIEAIFDHYDRLADNYRNRDINNVFSINQTNDEIEVDEDLIKMLHESKNVIDNGANNFNPLCGSLAKKWKEALANNTVLSNSVIEEELLKIQNSEIVFKEGDKVQRNGEAEIDLGGIAKGFALDVVKRYFEEKEMTHYLINAGSSSILLGEKNSKDGLFNVGLRDVDGAYLRLKNCFVSTSSISEQNYVIDGVTYSHIINPHTGSAISVNDAVVVVSNNGTQGDAFSTSMMMNTVEEIKEIEIIYNVKTLVIKNDEIIYQNPGIEVLYH